MNLKITSLAWLMCVVPFIQTGVFADTRGLDWKGPKKTIETPFISGDYHALIIGNAKYRDKKKVWKSLTTSKNDANALAKLLQTEYGFKNVSVMIDAGRSEILHALDELSDTVEPNDNVLIYYAGHGHLEDDKNRGYWIPTDAKGGDHSTYLRNSTIRDEINILAERTKHTLVISDSCFSGALMRSGSRGNGEEDTTKKGYYQKVAKKKSVQVLAAGGKEFVDDSYRSSGHSPFTYFLINELKTNTKALLSLTELATNVSIAVANNVDQTPESGVLLGAGDELGQFIFARVTVKEGDIKEVTIGAGAVPPEVLEAQKEKAPPPKLEDFTVPSLRL